MAFKSVAGLLPKSTRTENGLMGAGVRVHTGIITIPASGSIVLPYKVAGLLMVKNGYSWGGYNLYCGYMNVLNILSTPSGYNPVSSISISNGDVTIGNAATSQRQYRYVILNMSDPNDTAEYLID